MLSQYPQRAGPFAYLALDPFGVIFPSNTSYISILNHMKQSNGDAQTVYNGAQLWKLAFVLIFSL